MKYLDDSDATNLSSSENLDRLDTFALAENLDRFETSEGVCLLFFFGHEHRGTWRQASRVPYHAVSKHHFCFSSRIALLSEQHHRQWPVIILSSRASWSDCIARSLPTPDLATKCSLGAFCN